MRRLGHLEYWDAGSPHAAQLLENSAILSKPLKIAAMLKQIGIEEISAAKMKEASVVGHAIHGASKGQPASAEYLFAAIPSRLHLASCHDRRMVEAGRPVPLRPVPLRVLAGIET